jgi:hypothetical protein
MRKIYIALLLITTVCMLAAASSCKTLAVTGAKKYRVDITNAVNNISAEINSDGKISDQAYSKLKKVQDTYRAEFSSYGTFTKSEEIIKYIDEARADPNTAFAKYQQVQQDANYIVDMIRSEVPD